MTDLAAAFLTSSVATATAPERALLEGALGLSTAQALLPALLLFWAVTVPCVWFMVARPRLRDTLHWPVLVTAFAVWFTLGMGVECRVELGSGGDVVDLGHKWLAPLQGPLNSNPVVLANTGFILGLALFGCHEAFFAKRPALLLRALVCGVLRMTMGTLTQLPAPAGYVAVEGDWPPPPTEECKGFIFMPSGHVLASVITSLTLRRRGLVQYAQLVDFGCALQSLRLIATKGHFTADILVAVLLAVVVDQNLPGDRELQVGAGWENKKKKTEQTKKTTKKKTSSKRAYTSITRSRSRGNL